MMKQDTDWTCGIDAVSTRRPLSSVCRSNVGTAVDGIDTLMASGEKTRHAIAAQPDWLAAVPSDRRLPPGRILYTGCGTSFHAAQTGGEAVQALELVLRPEREADLLVCVSHEGTTLMTREAARGLGRPNVARDRARPRARSRSSPTR